MARARPGHHARGHRLLRDGGDDAPRKDAPGTSKRVVLVTHESFVLPMS